MRRLVAIALPGGPGFVAAVRSTWDAGDAVLVVDHRLPAPASAILMATARPHALIDDDRLRPIPVEPGAPPIEDGDALVIATSGSTGDPKLVVHTHSGLSAHASAVHQRLDVDVHRDRWLACLPLAHMGGLGVVLRSLLTDTPLDVIDGFSAEVVADAPVRLGSTLVSLVPTTLDRIAAADFRWVLLGGSADPSNRPPNVVRTYGLTETGGGVVYDGLPLDGVEVRVEVDGAIFLRGPMMTRGLRHEDGTTTAVTDPNGWLDTGDRGAWEEAGELRVDGRSDDLIVSGGENVWPEPVEARLRSHPSVRDVVVVGRPDPEWGQRVVAVVLAADPGAPPDLDQLRGWVRAQLPPWSAPREVLLVDRLPRTALGKPMRTEVSRQLPVDPTTVKTDPDRF
ncbi:MAG: AMP-binding protein [Aquihabitans sp.]